MNLPFPPEVIHCPPGEPIDLSGPPLGAEEATGCTSALGFGVLAAAGGAIFVLFLPALSDTRGASRGARLVWREHQVEAERAVQRQRAEAAGARPSADEVAPLPDTETPAPGRSAAATVPGCGDPPATPGHSAVTASTDPSAVRETRDAR